jgi:23S rRNA pseudouridine1911/1915/1917 synthase
MKREGLTRFDPRADVRTVGGNQSASIRASLLIERDTDLEHRKCVELLELGAVWGQDSRIRNDSLVPPKQRLFVYVSPRRFPIARSSNWNERIIAETDDYIVINKPGGVPSIVRADNAFESCIESAQRLVGPLHVLHRLDVPTHGLMVFAKNRNFKSHFYWEMRAHGVQKRYKALLTHARDASVLSSPLKNDTLITHYMMPSTYSPKVVSPTAQSGWLECRLRIVNVTILSINDLSSVAARLASPQRAGKGGGKAGGLRKRADLYEVEIELLTGRTHQIRAQLAALGFPVLGDSVYGGKWAMGAEKERKGRQGLEDEALGHLCLQACAITFTQPREIISFLDPGVAGGLCSFWIKGRCSRVVDGTCPFRPCNGTFRFPDLAKVSPEANSKLIQLLESEGPFKVMTHTSDEVSNVKERLHYLQKGARNHDQKICDGYQGKDYPFKNDLTRGKGGGQEKKYRGGEGKRDRLQFDIDGGSCDDEGEDAVGEGNEELQGEQLPGNEGLRSQTFRIRDPWWRDRQKCVEIKQNTDA